MIEALLERMGTAEAKALYRRRSQSVELVNADWKQHRKLRRGGRRRHIARVLLMPRRIGHDETPPLGGKVPIGDVDGNALLALRFQAIDQQREIELADRRGAEARRVGAECRQLVLVKQAAIKQQPPDQRRLAVVD